MVAATSTLLAECGSLTVPGPCATITNGCVGSGPSINEDTTYKPITTTPPNLLPAVVIYMTLQLKPTRTETRVAVGMMQGYVFLMATSYVLVLTCFPSGLIVRRLT